ncbi:hypothetical protein C3L33_06671, partial [Rhododendron williamsianum]
MEYGSILMLCKQESRVFVSSSDTLLTGLKVQALLALMHISGSLRIWIVVAYGLADSIEPEIQCNEALASALVLRSYGVVNLQNLIRSHVDMAKHFEGLVEMDSRFEVVVPMNFAMVCFRVSSLAVGDRLKSCDVKVVNEFNCDLFS